ncbi:MAG TPA: DUF481 domain-containing protein [Gemmatimonadales bacterium]|nr:DUF481 domain-containing protein [Gemmatimonadales bacterium]
MNWFAPRRAGRLGGACLCILTAAAAAPAGAQGPAPPEVKITANAGFVNASGNTEITTLSGDQRIEFRPAGTGWTFAQFLGAVYGRTNGETSANRLKGGARIQHVVGERLSAFLSAEYERNRFAGIKRRFEEAVGLTVAVVQETRTQFELEMGASLSQQLDLSDSSNVFVSARTAAEFKQLLTEAAYLQQMVEILPSLELAEDVRVNTETALVAPLSKRFAIKLSYAIRYDNLPEPGFRPTDRVFTSGLQMTL